MTGPTDFFGSADAHDRQQAVLLDTQVPLDAGMLYFDARLCEHQPTLEVRVADVSLEAEHAAVIATMIRALAEAAARAWQAGVPSPRTPTSAIRAWSWQASCYGIEEQLIDPATGTPAPAADVVAGLLDNLRPVLAEYGEDTAVESVGEDILRGGSGARRQRETYALRHDLRDVVSFALETTHRDGPAGSTRRE
ncbi:carboxylate-amine ligase [Corynebacterium halotolerans YIM 70093 = DSM 44683]|uniref:Carboxylate-amine ligase n=2 Tax=Corynebacterium halotolerans TaxID=225326 RepID=M1NSK1_9CORY|nr:carboxylate-amine ligase [Corynebacterium halotolerans YIM 70093 = DSM 44683]